MTEDKKDSKILSLADAARRKGKPIRSEGNGQASGGVPSLTEMVDIKARQDIYRLVDWIDEIDERLDRHSDAIRALLNALKELKQQQRPKG